MNQGKGLPVWSLCLCMGTQAPSYTPKTLSGMGGLSKLPIGVNIMNWQPIQEMSCLPHVSSYRLKSLMNCSGRVVIDVNEWTIDLFSKCILLTLHATLAKL